MLALPTAWYGSAAIPGAAGLVQLLPADAVPLAALFSWTST
jgi:hypothetical protein